MRDRPVRGASHVAGCTGLRRPPPAVAGQGEQSALGRRLRSRNRPAAGPGSRLDYGGLGGRPRSGECRGAREGQVPPTVPPSLPFPRFYKLHERKCEPIVMTVPRKVRPPAHPLRSPADGPRGGDRAEACERDVVECGCGQWAGRTAARLWATARHWAVPGVGQEGVRQGEPCLRVRPCSGRATGGREMLGGPGALPVAGKAGPSNMAVGVTLQRWV